MKLRLTEQGPVVHRDDARLLLDCTWDDIFRHDDPVAFLRTARGASVEAGAALAPVSRQEVWAAGVTYYASRQARVEESEKAADVYEQVYDAARPELFYKSAPERVVGPGGEVRIRADSRWNVPEPELTLAISAESRLFGYTIGNDMSSRDIEGENPLYLPQAKVYDGSAALGPELLVTDQPLDPGTAIGMRIERADTTVFSGSTTVSQIKRPFDELIDYLTREITFEHGCYLMTGAGVVPHSDFTLQQRDIVTISINGIGALTNVVG